MYRKIYVLSDFTFNDHYARWKFITCKLEHRKVCVFVDKFFNDDIEILERQGYEKIDLYLLNRNFINIKCLNMFGKT